MNPELKLQRLNLCRQKASKEKSRNYVKIDVANFKFFSLMNIDLSWSIIHLYSRN